MNFIVTSSKLMLTFFITEFLKKKQAEFYSEVNLVFSLIINVVEDA